MYLINSAGKRTSLEEQHRMFRKEEQEQEQEEDEEARKMCNWTVKAAATSSGESRKKKIFSLLPRKRWPRRLRLLASVGKSHAREGDEHDH